MILLQAIALGRKTAVFLILILFAGCARQAKQPFVIGISQLGDADAWRKEMRAEMDRELVFNPDLRIVYRQADYNSQTQVQQIRELVRKKIDLLIVSPNEAAPLTPIIDSVYKSGIPVITVDRNINSGSYTSFIGADNTEVGRLAGMYAADFLEQKGNILEITGLQSSTPARQREKGFADVMKDFPQIKVQVIRGDWLEGSVQKQLPALTAQLRHTQLIFAHNDVMANTAAAICRQLGFPGIRVIGVDAQPGTGLKFVEHKALLASVLYPTGGGEAIRAAARILHKQEVPKRDFLRTIIVDSTNVVMLQQQFNKVIDQQKDIVRQDLLLKRQAKTFRTQKNLIGVLLGTLFLLLMLSGLLIYLRRKNIRAYKLLRAQNHEIRSQSEQINAMAQQVQEASEQKLNFFTNVSHELKTPLTLILAPADEALRNTRTPAYLRGQFALIRKNASRLLLLVNQLMDFRKLELNKMTLRVQETDLVLFVNELLGAFGGLAQQRNIDFRLLTKETSLKCWIDPEKMEKVLFNLFSNAFKFTPDSGHVYVTLETDLQGSRALIKVADSGAGLSGEEQARLFEFFYQGNVRSQNGSGVGLALSKELVELHKGSIWVESEKHRGAVFVVALPLGDALLREPGVLRADPSGYHSNMPEWVEHFHIENNALPQPLPDAPEPAIRQDRMGSILVVEDNDDLRRFLSERLQGEYHVITARNGSEGIRTTFEEFPDLVLSDIMMPDTDGLQLANVLKSDIRTAHIPVVLLTAKTTDDNQVEGLRTNADAYLVKPFRMDVLEQTIRGLLKNRQHLKEHLTAAIPKEVQQTGGKNEKRFLADLNAVIEKNLANEQFSIQDLCRALGLSKIQLYRKAKPLLQAGIHEYILNQRIQKAQYLIRQGTLSFAEIAYQTGFSSPSYFSTSFKKITGVTPKAYKDQFGSTK
ncbi:substrate-binding domain-containing protein [Niabella sp. CC-SYL272]|uniref:substrate-binding domain-containing protein n=1 Tax=Niabella agricola TaxID=2891571 RepID=UPI001F43409F|nr:substrate-binding domain-containing protein [Niabella agricola]MCF3108839.1 substrate-binding domain-containing protein [Niabella agricola]